MRVVMALTLHALVVTRQPADRRSDWSWRVPWIGACLIRRQLPCPALNMPGGLDPTSVIDSWSVSAAMQRIRPAKRGA